MKRILAHVVALAALPSIAAPYGIIHGIGPSPRHRGLYKIDLQTLEVSKIDSSPGLDLGEHAVLRSGQGRVFALSQEQKRIHFLDANRNFIWERSLQGDAQPADWVTLGSEAFVSYPNSKAVDRVDLGSASVSKRYVLPNIPGQASEFRAQYLAVRGGKVYATADEALNYPYNPIARIDPALDAVEMAFVHRFFDTNLLFRGENLVIPYFYQANPWLIGTAPAAWSTTQVPIAGVGTIAVIDGQMMSLPIQPNVRESIVSMDCLDACEEVLAIVRHELDPSGETRLSLESLNLSSGERREHYGVSGVRFGLGEGKYFPNVEYQETFEELDAVRIDPITRRIVVLERSDEGSGIHVFESDGTDLGLHSLGEGVEPFSMTLVDATPSDERLEGDLVLRVWPNPAAEGRIVTVYIETTSPRGCSLRAFNSRGQAMAWPFDKLELTHREKTLSFDPSALRWSSGTYVLGLQCGPRRVAKKLVYVNL